MERTEIISALGIMIVMFLILVVALVNNYSQIIFFSLGIILGVIIFLFYRFFKEYGSKKEDRN